MRLNVFDINLFLNANVCEMSYYCLQSNTNMHLTDFTSKYFFENLFTSRYFDIVNFHLYFSIFIFIIKMLRL